MSPAGPVVPGNPGNPGNSDAPRAQLGEELLKRFVATLRAAQLYSHDHPIVTRNVEALSAAVQLLLSLEPTVVIGVVGDEIVVDDRPLPRAEALGGLVRRLKDIGVERVTLDRGVSAAELAVFIKAVGVLERAAEGESPSFLSLTHIRVGRIVVGERVDTGAADMASFRRMYGDAVSVAETVWESARTEEQPDATMAQAMIEGLAQAVSQNRTALLALTTLKNYDNYTFTHMVNVSILTMGQARALGIDGPLLREIGLAALMHDIGKVKTPLEILNKPDKLTDAEFAIMQRHTVDGAEILRGTPDIPTLAPVVAFEHHLRLDGTGYPRAAVRASLNLGTMLCSIADVYDAMRSQRKYQESYPTDRILEVLRRSDGQQFDQHLVRRFAQLVGIYPVGNLVKLDTGEVAIVTAVHAPDSRRPRVRVIIGRDGARVEVPYEINLWESEAPAGDPLDPAVPARPTGIVSPVDPAAVGNIDPLALL
jgi:putative nucleotidyltransferase with HDIG domain